MSRIEKCRGPKYAKPHRESLEDNRCSRFIVHKNFNSKVHDYNQILNKKWLSPSQILTRAIKVLLVLRRTHKADVWTFENNR